jgi:predicted HTH domain antitoxin
VCDAKSWVYTTGIIAAPHQMRRLVNEILKRFVAFDLYKNKSISLGYCAELAEMPKEDFLKFLGSNKVSIFDYDNESEFLEEVNNA